MLGIFQLSFWTLSFIIGFHSFMVRITSGAVLTCDHPSVTQCPFDDLSAEEISSVHRILLNSLGELPSTIQYPIIRTQEPSKSDWLAGLALNSRLAYVALFDLATNSIVEVKIDLRSERILNMNELPAGILPPVTGSEWAQGQALVRSSPEWISAVISRGLNPSDMSINTWAPRPLSANDTGPNIRMMRAVTNYKPPNSTSSHWAVVEGLIVTIDLHNNLVIDVWNDDSTIPMTSSLEELPNFDSKPPLQPLIISQPSGSSIKVQGQHISWYKWNFQYSVDPIYGLQLYHVTYNGDCEDRSILYKISMAEMFVPYGASGRGWRWRAAFDAGEYGIGKGANKLRIGLDVPENALLFNCTMANDSGEGSYSIEGCVAAYEKDIGVLYKHSQGEGNADGRRGRVLVLTLMTTIGNYDYTFDYIFHMDGTIDIKNRLTGIVLARGNPTQTNDPNTCLTNCTNLLNDYLIAPPHQHFFNYRLDLDIDGVDNYVAQVDVTADPASTPEESGIFSPKKSFITSEGFDDYNIQTSRSWHVLNGNSRNQFGSPRGYALKPETIGYTYLPEQNPIFEYSTFIQHPIWVTKYNDNEQTPAHKFPRTGEAGAGLPSYISNQESLLNSDNVLWYTYGVTHSTRAEEWPIMNVHVAGFSLIPYNFLSYNAEMALKDKCV